MKGQAASKSPLLISALGAAVTLLGGLFLWWTPFGEPLVNASYDYLFRFSARPVTNNVALILMDNSAFAEFHQNRSEPWDRGWHAKLLNRLADDGCALVVFDSFFRDARNPADDAALADAMRRQKNVVLMAEQAEVTHPTLTGVQPILPWNFFLNAAGTNWGVAWLTPDRDSIVRRQWPFPSPGVYPSLPWTAARLAGAKLSQPPQERWLRYYGEKAGWSCMSYQFAFRQPTNYFRNKIVFIGMEPKTSTPHGETDQFRTPYTRWTDEASGGVDILITAFLNLLNHDWLQRPAGGVESSLLIATGLFLGGGLCRLSRKIALIAATTFALMVALAGILLSDLTNYWFPWLVVAGGQVPCALAWALAMRNHRSSKPATEDATELFPETPGYKLFHPPFGEGAYGKVWLARTAAGEWRALKVIYLAKFENNPDPYEREYNGVQRYQPISDQHPGLLRVDFVSEKLEGYFYYTMELGDALEAGWETRTASYRPRDLTSERARLHGRRLPVKECLRIGISLCEALDFLHQRGMTHRDIKPQNIIFVNGQPKLADLGLITDIRPADLERTLVGTPGYMPPPPERPGTAQADIYALGIVLYVLSTGRNPGNFPDISTTLVSNDEAKEFLPLNAIFLKACHPDPAHRFKAAAELRQALQAVEKL